MKRTKYILNGFLALAMAFIFAQCAENKGTASTASSPAAVSSGNLKIAYVEIDSLLTKYRYWNDLNELMIQKEENIRTTLNEKAKELEKEMREFQRNWKTTVLQAANVQNRKTFVWHRNSAICNSFQEKLANDLQTENQKNSLQLRDSINSFLKIYNKDKGYSLIISNTGITTCCCADQAFNITSEIVDGLNARYNPHEIS